MKTLKKSIFFLLFVAVTSVFAQQQSPNILLIIADDLGVDAISGFGVNTDLPNTPTLDAFRANGISYTNCWAAPQCTPTRASIMSGKYGIKTGVLRPPTVLETSHTSLFTKIKEQSSTDYSMAVIGKWHLGGSNSSNSNHPTDSGVPFYEGVFTSQVDDYYNWTKTNSSGNNEQITEYTTAHFTNSAISWVANQTKPWFLWLAHVAPHAPFQIPPSGTYTSNPADTKGIYNAMIENMDYEINRLLESMDATTRENTVIIFIGDNGTPARANTHFPSRRVKSSLYSGGVTVPMIITGKSVQRVNEVEEGLVHAADLHATILELAGVELLGGTENSLSLKPSLSSNNQINREINYVDYESDGVESWATRTKKYKLIEDENGREEFYDLENDFLEANNLINNLTSEQQTIKTMLQQEAQVLRTSWSCNDGIQNGNETTIDDCDSTCGITDVLSFDNIACCDTTTSPSIYYEFTEDNQRVVYANNYPNHDFCARADRKPEPSFRLYKFDINPELTETLTSVTRDNGRPANYFGIAMNGVAMMPAPAAPFIFENTSTGEYNWDWVFEPTTNIGSGREFVGLDCASAHVNTNIGYHYHGNMYEYVEELKPGISTTEEVPVEVLQVGWAGDGFPILYKFGPDKDGNLKQLQPSFQLKSGLRPGDGISAPCGPYSGKYTNDFEYVSGKGDLDECNGIAASVTLTTAQGEETFDYYYVVTASFPQIPRCMKGNFSTDFANSSPALNDVDRDSDGFASAFDCDDTNANINPFATDNPATAVDESCGATLSTPDFNLEELGFYVTSKKGGISVISTNSEEYQVGVFSLTGQLIDKQKGVGVLEFNKIARGSLYIVRIAKNGQFVGTHKIIVR